MGEEETGQEGRHGLRIASLRDGRAIIRQTVLREAEPAPVRRYVDDVDDSGNRREHIVNLNDDKAIADAVRAALSGELIFRLD